MKFLNPRNDAAFKRVFGTKKNEDILIHFLNDMLEFKQQKPITQVTFLKTIQAPEIVSQKVSIVDVLCSDEDNNKYIVEMQVDFHKGFDKRAQYYAAKAYVNQMQEGDFYENLKGIIFIAITNFIMFPNKEDFKSDHIILDKKTKENDLKDFSFTFLELPKFKKKIDELETMIDKWAYYFKHADKTSMTDLKHIFSDCEVILNAYDELDRFQWSDEELTAYEEIEKNRMDYEMFIRTNFEQGIEKGIEKGIEEGMERGMQKGMEKGREEGIQEAYKKMVKAFMSKGMNKEMILDIMKITEKEFLDYLQ